MTNLPCPQLPVASWFLSPVSLCPIGPRAVVTNVFVSFGNEHHPASPEKGNIEPSTLLPLAYRIFSESGVSRKLSRRATPEKSGRTSTG